jgi:hypothetical protein
MAKKENFLAKLYKPFKGYFEENKRKKKIKKKLKRGAVNLKFIELERVDGNLENFENFLKNYGKIGIILGARGSGKSALGIRILENINSIGKKVYALGFRKDRLPKWIIPVIDINEIPNNSFLLADEAGIEFSSRSSMSSLNKLLSNLLLISRHKNISIIFITQNSSNIEINTLRQADYLLLKPSSLLQLDFERKKIRDIYKEVDGRFKKYYDKGTTYIYSDLYRGFVKTSLPSFWTEDLSKSFAK